MTETKRREAEKHRQCPICYHGDLNGVGSAYRTANPTTYYKCDRCGHTWTAIIRRVVTTTHREIEVQHREPEVTERADAQSARVARGRR